MNRFLLLLLLVISFGLYAQQTRDDALAAQQYVQWIQRAIDDDRWNDANAALLRARNFENVSSDISYLAAIVNNRFGANRNIIVQDLNKAIETNRWVSYSVNHALLLKAELLIILRRYISALNGLDQIVERGELASNAQMRADAAVLRLMALRGLAEGKETGYDSVHALAQFRSFLLTTMDRFPRDPRPLRIFFQYARNRSPEPSDLPSSDINLLELALRRLPFLLEIDPCLAWMAAPFIRDVNTARRLVGSYRAMSPSPAKASIPVALNLGLIDDNTAIKELFAEDRPPIHYKDVLIDTYRLLRSEEGREYFTRHLLSFSGQINYDSDRDGIIDIVTVYESGNVSSFSFDKRQENEFGLLRISFDPDGVPSSAVVPVTGYYASAEMSWERYPSVKSVVLRSPILAGRSITFNFAPVDFQYAPVLFETLGGSRNLRGVFFPVPSPQYIELAYQTLLSFCSTLIRPSLEIEGAQETIYMNRGVILQAVETLNGHQVSVTEFERGLPVIQHIDLDLDGRMETIRRFRTPNNELHDILNFRSLIASSESDWSGDGRHKTREVYLPDGSVVYYFDMDGSGTWTHSETGNRR